MTTHVSSLLMTTQTECLFIMAANPKKRWLVIL